MASSKKKQEEARLRRRQTRMARERSQERSSTVSKSFVEIDLMREIEHIAQLAQAGESRLVTLGDCVLFSTRTHDAWLLDREDQFAACVCWDSVLQPITIVDTPETIGVVWTAKFEIDRTVFRVFEQTGKGFDIESYPTAEISAALAGR